jgi:hypothetical protein
MRRAIPILFLLFAYSAPARAEASFRMWEVSLFGGFALNHHNALNLGGSVGSDSGLAFGLGISYHFSQAASVGIEALRITKGYVRTDAGTTTRNELQYLEVPVQLTYQISSLIALHGGVYIPSILIGARQISGGSAVEAKRGFSDDYGFTAGLRLGFRANPRFLIAADFRFDFGLANILGDNDPTHTLATRSFMTLANMVFGF